MSSKFQKGFVKQAGLIAPIAKTVGKKALGLMGGIPGVALTGLGAISDYGDIAGKMKRAREGML